MHLSFGLYGKKMMTLLLASVFMLSSSVVFASEVSLSVSRAQQKKIVEVVFVLDTTGSMSGLIDGAKKKIWSIANTIVDDNPGAEVRMGLVGYRDRGDEYVTRYYPLTTDIQAIYGKLLSFEAAGGGDTPESVNEALDVAVSKLGWSDPQQVRADRILFLVGDAPPHMDYKQDKKYPVVVKEALAKEIIVNTILVGESRATEKVWRKIASLGKGVYLAVPQDGGTIIIIKTPYDNEIQTIQIELNKTIIPYGNQAQQDEVYGKASMYEKSPAAPEMTKFVNKSGAGKKVVTGSGDLVNDIYEKKISLDAIKSEELPEQMKKMTRDEQNAYILAQEKTRDKLSKQLAEKVLERDKYLLQKAKESAGKSVPDSFDSMVKDTLLKQIK